MTEHNAPADYVRFFRHSSPYIHAHRGKTFVIMLGGDALAHENCTAIINDIALLNSLGIRLVLVHGARVQIEQRLKEAGLTSHFHQNRRITDKPVLKQVKDAVGHLRSDIESRLSMGLVNSPMHGACIRVVSGNFVTARPYGIHDGVDYQHTGEVRKIDHQAISQLLDHGYIVLLSCLGLSPTGEIFNLEAEEVASFTATGLGAEKLILFGEQPGIFNHTSELISRISPSEAEPFLPHLSLNSQRLLGAAITACRGGVARCQIISYKEEGSLLLELFTRKGAGTLVSQDHYEELRQAGVEDIGGILELIRPLETTGVLRRRSRKELEREIQWFSVIVLDGMIIGCTALRPFADSNCAELACLVVHPDYRCGQRGDWLLEHTEKLAVSQGIDTLFVLTTRTAHWFVERGFVEASIQALPEEKRASYSQKRQSKVFIKKIR